MSKAIVIIVYFFVICVSATDLLAQEEMVQEELLEEEIVPITKNPSATSPLGSPQIQPIFEATREAKVIRAHIGYRAKDSIFDLKISGPIDEQATEANLGTLDGLADSTTADLGYTRIRFNPRPARQGSDFNDLANDVLAICDRYKQTLSLSKRVSLDHKLNEMSVIWQPDDDIPVAFLQQLKERKSLSEKRLYESLSKEGKEIVDRSDPAVFPEIAKRKKILDDLNNILQETNLRKEEPDVALPPALESASFITKEELLIQNRVILEQMFPQTIRKSPEDVDCDYETLEKTKFFNEYLALIDFGYPLFAFGGRARAGRKSFKYLGTKETDGIEQLTDITEVHTGYSATVFGGLLTEGHYYIGINYTEERAYKGGKPREICFPVLGRDALQCTDLAQAAPTRETARQLQVELKKFILPKLAVNPRITFDLEKDIRGVEIPIYFLQGKDEKGLTGGVALGWRSDTDDLSVRLFVGGDFGLLPR